MTALDETAAEDTTTGGEARCEVIPSDTPPCTAPAAWRVKICCQLCGYNPVGLMCDFHHNQLIRQEGCCYNVTHDRQQCGGTFRIEWEHPV